MDDLIEESSTQVKQSKMTDVESQRVTDCAQMTWSQAVGAMFVKAPFDNVFCGKVLLDFLVSLEPQDETEGMLCSRLLVLRYQYMNCMTRCANPEQTNSCIDTNIIRDTKFMGLFNVTLAALNKHRWKREQKIPLQPEGYNANCKYFKWRVSDCWRKL